MTIATAGMRMIVSIRTGIATHRTTVSACCLQRSFGTISPNMRTITVMITVERVDASASPPFMFASNAIAMEVAAVEAAILARLLPMSIADSAVVK